MDRYTGQCGGKILDGSLQKDLGRYRDELVISTKAGYDMWPGPYGNWGSKKYLVASLDQSLKRMGLDYVDIFYHHRPDPNTPLEETVRALDGIVKSGKALYVGISNYNKEQTIAAAELFKELGTPFIINQRKYSMFVRDIEKDGLKDYAAAHGIGIITFSPLAQGLLTDRYLHGIPEDSRVRTDGRFLKEAAIVEETLKKVRALNDLASQRGQTLAQMALSWILRDGDITSVLIGLLSPHRSWIISELYTQPLSAMKKDVRLRRFWHKKKPVSASILQIPAFALSSVENLCDRRVRRQDHGFIITGHGSLQSIQASDEGIEVLFGCIGIGLRQDFHVFRFSLRDENFCIFVGFRQEHVDLLICGIADLLCLGASLCGIGRGDVFAFGDHALVHSGFVVTGQIQLFGFEGEQFNTVLLGGVSDIFHDGCRQLSVTPGDHIILSSAADDVLW